MTCTRRPLAIAAALLALVPGARASAAVPVETCTRESHVWSGSATLSGDDVFDTGLVVPSQLGTTLRVVGVSADGLDGAGDATAVPVTIAGTPLLPGVMLSGGPVRIHGGGATSPLTVSGATVVVDRCALVASAPAPDPVLPGPELPATGPGATPRVVALAGSVLLAAGLVLAGIGRRATGGDRGRGSLPAAARPPRG